MIIGVSGKKGTGKDTIAEFIVKKFGFVRYAFADPIKLGCREIFGFNDKQLWGDKKEIKDEHWGVTPRKVLQVVGTELFKQTLPRYLPEITKFGNYFWQHRFIRWYKNNRDINVVIPDVRMLSEIRFLRQLQEEIPIFIIKVLRKTGRIDTHSTEMDIDKITDVDAIIENNSKKSFLYKIVDKKVSKFIKNVSNKNNTRT